MLTQYGRLLSLSNVLCVKLQSARGILSLLSFRSFPTDLWRTPFSIVIVHALHELKGPDGEDAVKDFPGRDELEGIGGGGGRGISSTAGTSVQESEPLR